MTDTKQVTIPPPKYKIGQIFEAKKPKAIGFYQELNDRQILYVSSHRSHISYIDHGFTQEFLDWCGRYPSRQTFSEYDQFQFERETNKNAKNIESVFDYAIQYDSPTVKDGKKYPSVSEAEFFKWAGKEVTELVPEGNWRRK